MTDIINKILVILKDSPTLVVIIVVVYLLTEIISSKLDTINSTLTDIHTSNVQVLERMASEADDTKDFVAIQSRILDLLTNGIR